MSSDKISRPDGRLSLSNSVPPRAGQEKTSNACGMPGGMFKLRFDWYISANCLHKIQDSFPCTYMRVHVNTSYKMLKHVSLYTKQFPLVWCGQFLLLLMLKTHSTVQRGSNSLFNGTRLFFGAFTDTCMFTCLLFLYLTCFN